MFRIVVPSAAALALLAGTVAAQENVAVGSAGAILAEQEDDQMLTEEIIGASVYSPEEEEIGAIQGLVFDPEEGVTAALVGIGGFLGLGAKEVAVNWDELADREDGYVLDMTAEELENAPEFATLEDKRIAEEQARMQQQMEAETTAPATAPVAPPPTTTQ